MLPLPLRECWWINSIMGARKGDNTDTDFVTGTASSLAWDRNKDGEAVIGAVGRGPLGKTIGDNGRVKPTGTMVTCPELSTSSKHGQSFWQFCVEIIPLWKFQLANRKTFISRWHPRKIDNILYLHEPWCWWWVRWGIAIALDSYLLLVVHILSERSSVLSIADEINNTNRGIEYR